MKTKFLAFLALLMTALMWFALPTHAQTETYNLFVFNQQVTSDNADNILGDGSLSYDASTNKLTISGDVNENNDNNNRGITTSIPGLVIYVANDVTVRTYINVFSDATITGPGKLSIITSADCALYVEAATLTIKDANVDASGAWGIAGDPYNEHLIIKNSYVHATGWKGAICDFTSITLKSSSITQPEGGYVDGGEIVNSDGYQAPEVTINPKLEIYDLKIGDKQVTSDNADDILGDGTLSYDPSAEILEICGDISDNNNIENNIQDLIIFVRTDITLQSFISTYKNVVVSGPGTLNIITPGYNCLFAENSNIYLEEANVDVSGTWGISGVTSNENLIIKKSYVHAYGQYGAIFNFNSISLEDCVIIQPEGGYVDGGTIVDANGNVAKEVTIIPTPEKYDLKICGQQVTSLNSNDVLGDGVFKYDDDNNTLTVNGDVTYNGCIIYNEIQDLTIDVTGNSTLSSTNATIITEKNITFKGNGILTLTSSKDCGLYILDSTVTIENLSLESVGKWGIAGYPNDEHLIVRNSEVHASGRVCAICDFSSISIDGCDIVLPEGGYVDGGYIADANGSVATEVIIAKQGDIITGYEYEGSFWATYFNSTVSKKADGNTTVYMATLSADNSELALNEVADRIIPAGQAVILKSSEKSILLTKTSETSSGNFEGNCLSGCDWPTDVPTDQGTIYTMNEEHEQLGFYRFAGKKLGAHKAYLAIRSNGAPTRITFDMDEATGIESIEDLNIYDLRFDAEGYYNIDGRHFNGNPTAPGIYIVNGRKVLITGRTQR